MDPQQARECVVYLSGPRNRQDCNGSPKGRSNVSRVRLQVAVQVALARGCRLFAPIKESERCAHRRDLRKIVRKTGYRATNAAHELGVAHTLANAWSSLRYAYRHGYRHLIVVTSEWHCARAEIAFRGLAAAIGLVMGYEVMLEFVTVPMSKSRRVRRFELYVMTRVERDEKQPDERERVEDYVRAVVLAPLVNGFVSHPDELCPFSHRPQRTYQSIAERNQAAV